MWRCSATWGCRRSITSGDGSETVDDLSAHMLRARLGAELSHRSSLGDGNELGLFVESAGRYLGGSEDDSLGLEITGRAQYTHREPGFGLEARGLVVALSSEPGHRE